MADSDATGLTAEDVRYSMRKELLDAIDSYKVSSQNITTEETKKPKGFLGAETRGAETIVITEEARRIIEMIEGLAKYNPTAVPVRGFLGYKQVKEG